MQIWMLATNAVSMEYHLYDAMERSHFIPLSLFQEPPNRVSTANPTAVWTARIIVHR